MLAHQGDVVEVMVLANGLIALGHLFGRGHQEDPAMLENTMIAKVGWIRVSSGFPE